jgi:hypothetical protein
LQKTFETIDANVALAIAESEKEKIRLILA